MNNRVKASIIALCLAIAASSSPGQKVLPDKDAASDWTKAKNLPIVRAKLIKPKQEMPGFSSKFPHDVQYVNPVEKRDAGAETSQRSDAAAQAAASEWLFEHFGTLPKDTTLTVSFILHSASGRETPKFGWDKGHTIGFQELYHGIPTIGSACVYMTNTSITAASISLYRFTPEAGAKEILGSELALKVFENTMRERSVNAFQHIGKRLQLPILGYDRDPNDNKDISLDYDVLSPNWTVDSEGVAKVNAFTGRFWIDD